MQKTVVLEMMCVVWNRPISKFTDLLGLRARLSQGWFSSGLLCLIVYIVKLQLLKQFLKGIFTLMSKVIINECQTVTIMADKVLQTPQEAIVLANRLVTSSVNSAIRALLDSISDMLQAVEGLIMFALDIAVGTYACLTIAAVNIAANEAINATEAVIGVANRTAENIGKDINKGLSKLSDFINGAEGLIDSVEEFITGGSADLSSVNLTVSRLDHLNISSNINTKLEDLRKEVPTYDKTKAAVSKLISEPFKYLESRINSTNITFHLAPLPALKSTNITGCDIPKISSDLEKLENYVLKVINILCGLCAIAAVAAILFNLWKAKSQFRRLETVAASSIPFNDSKSLLTTNMELITMAETSFPERILLKRLSPRSRWLLRYALHAPLLTILCLGLAGIVISLLELIILSLLKSGFHKLDGIVVSVADDVTGQITRALGTWRDQTNGQIAHTESEVNHQILGWVHQGSQSVNSSLSVFMSSINGEIGNIFNGTMFLKPLQAIVYCMVGSKVKKVEEGLTWVYDHSQITLPRIPAQVISMNSTNGTVARAQKDAQLVLQTAMSTIHQQIVVQSIVSSVFVSVWLLFIIGAYVYAFILTEPVESETSASSTKEKRPRPSPPALSQALHISPVRVRSRVKSPVERISDQFSRMLAGPARIVRTSGVPQRGSIHFAADSPRTPLNTHKFTY